MNKIAASVCVVDDDASIRESVEGLFWAEGLRVETYCPAREFLARTTVEPPGCLVLDVELPGLSGLELQRELFRTEAHIPVEILAKELK
jgi:FixJ family two-component response regulator